MIAGIRQGLLCRDCTGSKCYDAGTPQEPLLIECPSCFGDGCENCDEGRVEIEGCPQEYCASMSPLVNYVELFRKGMPPVAGGALDQSAWFLAAERQLRLDEEQAKADRRG